MANRKSKRLQTASFAIRLYPQELKAAKKTAKRAKQAFSVWVRQLIATAVKADGMGK